MKDASTYFTIARVDFNPILLLDEYIRDIQDRMRRAGYADFKLGTEVNVVASLNNQRSEGEAETHTIKKNSFAFFNTTNTEGFVVKENQISFQATLLESPIEFISKIIQGLDIVHQAVKLSYFDQFDLRKLSVVIPEHGEKELPNYLTSGVLGLADKLENAKVAYSYSETNFGINECLFSAKTFICKGKLGFPNDVQPVLAKLQDKFQCINDIHAIIDIGARIKEREDVFNAKNIESYFEKLIQGMDMALKATLDANENIGATK